jgi:hypothetical protein
MPQGPQSQFNITLPDCPDLVARMAAGAALTPPDMSTFYTPWAKGYIDYPATA